MQEVCRHRGWVLRAANIRVNHVHAVLQAKLSPERVMNDLKAWATRRVVEAGLRPRGTRLWVRHGSTRHLWRPEAVNAACAYTLERQGGGARWAFG
jgi:REP element-mobilizing transposase RayT